MNHSARPRRYAIVATIVSMIFLLFPFIGVAAEEKGKVYEIATDATYPPFEYEDGEGNYVGIDLDLIKAIAEDQGFEYNLTSMDFTAGLQALESAQIDVLVAAMTITEERSKAFDFSDPYYEAGPVLAVAEDNEDITSYEDLDGKTLAVRIGTTGDEMAQELAKKYNITINHFEDSSAMFSDVEAGHSDACIDDNPIMAYSIQQGLKLKMPLEPEYGDEYGFAVPKDRNGELLDMLNAGLKNIQDSGEYDEILDKYLADDADELDQSTFLSLLKANLPDLMAGLGRTLALTVISFLIALFFGMILGLFSATPNRFLNLIANLYVTVMRGVPLIVLAFFMYFSLPQFTGVKIAAFTAGIITLSLNTTAYIAEQVRGGINAVSVGQLEAARSLGLPYGVSMRKVVLPQAIKIMVPSLINQFVITLKDTSVLSIIGILELTQTGRIIIARTYASGLMWIIVGAIYLIIITLLTQLSNILERRITY